jgi:hypothetical protein
MTVPDFGDDDFDALKTACREMGITVARDGKRGKTLVVTAAGVLLHRSGRRSRTLYGGDAQKTNESVHAAVAAGQYGAHVLMSSSDDEYDTVVVILEMDRLAGECLLWRFEKRALLAEFDRTRIVPAGFFATAHVWAAKVVV